MAPTPLKDLATSGPARNSRAARTERVGPVLSDRPCNDASRLSPDATGTVAKHAAIAHGRRHEQASGLAAAKRIQHDRDLVVHLHVTELPAGLHQDARTAQLDAPVLDRALLVR